MAGLPPEVLLAARQAGVDEDDLVVLLPLLAATVANTGASGVEELVALMGLLGGEPPDDLLDELFETIGDVASCDCRRPADIARSAQTITDVLEQAMVHRWTVRLAVSRRRKQPKSFFAEVEHVDTDSDAIVVWSHEQDRDLQLPVASVAWARVLTEAEEHALFASEGS